MSQTKTLNIVPDDSLKRIHLSQGDLGRTLIFKLFEGSASYSPPTGATVKIVGTKPSGVGYSVNGTFSGNTVTIVTTSAMTDEYGAVMSELVVTNQAETEIFKSANFLLLIEKDPHPAGTVDGESSIVVPTLLQLQSAIGDLTQLNTTDKTSLVGAINELSVDAIRGIHVTLTSSNVTGDYTNMDTFPMNSVVIVAASAFASITNYPKSYSTGGTVVTFNSYGTKAGCVQIVYFFNGFSARRINVSNTWMPWEYSDIYYRTYKVRSDGSGDFSNLVNAIKNTMTSGLASYYYRYIIDVGEGEFDLRSASDMVTGGTIDQRGLFIMPYVTIRGKGKDKTKLTYYYGGSNDSIMSMVSGLNMPYESALEDLTLSVKDIRYAIHSDNPLTGESSDFTNTNLNNNKITLKNVCLEHLGFSSGKNPTYKVPAAWGGGSWNATDREFINCDFISTEVCGFLNHDRVGITKPSNFTFKDCNFITYNSDVRATANTAYSSCALISWGSGIKTNVSFDNCIVNKFVALTVVTTYNESAVIDYKVKANNDLFIIESDTNNSQLNDNFRNADCLESICASSAGIIAYAPVSKNRLYWVHRWQSGEAVQGIALNSCAQNEPCIIQTKGFVAIPLLTASTFSDGAYIGYSGGAWVVDTTNPIIRVMGGNVGVIL